MTHRSCPALLLLTLLLAGCLHTAPVPGKNGAGVKPAEPTLPPNVLLFFTDDQGYGDLSCTGNPTIHTPSLDALAANGRRFTQFYVASPVCSPSRAALLTGCYPKRVGMHEHVVFPEYERGMHPDERTLAELLRDEGYATGCFGKWHLGHRPGMLPTDQGFDTWFGIPYSNDMAQIHRPANNRYAYRLPLLRDEEVIEWEPDQRLLTHRITEAARDFIRASKDGPWFAYVPHPMPHIPIYASEEFEGTSRRGLYGDVIEELDASVGTLVETLRELDLLENTLILFATDNGPWLPYGVDGGSAGPLRGGKGSNWEGGQRVPLIAHWPGHVRAGSLGTEVGTTMDLLPTIAALTGADLPGDRTLDGQERTAWLLGDGEVEAPAPFVYYTSHGKLAGVRRGPWKLLLEGPALFHLEHDISEKHDLAGKQPELVQELRLLARRIDAELEAGARPAYFSSELLFDPAR